MEARGVTFGPVLAPIEPQGFGVDKLWVV